MNVSLLMCVCVPYCLKYRNDNDNEEKKWEMMIFDIDIILFVIYHLNPCNIIQSVMTM